METTCIKVVSPKQLCIETTKPVVANGLVSKRSDNLQKMCHYKLIVLSRFLLRGCKSKLENEQQVI